MLPENVPLVAQALKNLGLEYRMDWSDFDGRSAKLHLEDLASALLGNKPFDLRSWQQRNLSEDVLEMVQN